jgi:hypothetical protein
MKVDVIVAAQVERRNDSRLTVHHIGNVTHLSLAPAGWRLTPRLPPGPSGS